MHHVTNVMSIDVMEHFAVMRVLLQLQYDSASCEACDVVQNQVMCCDSM